MAEELPASSHPRFTGTPSAAEAAAKALSRLTDLARTSLQMQASVARQSVDLTWASLAGDLDRTSANKAYFESVARESLRYWRTIGELGVDYITDLLTLTKSVSTTVLREVAAAGKVRSSRQPPETAEDSVASRPLVILDDDPSETTFWPMDDESSPGTVVCEASGRRVPVTLRGAVGQRAEGKVLVANQHTRPRRIQLSGSDLVDSRGAAVGAALAISPNPLTVPSGQERWVKLGIDLDSVSFSAGELYFCTAKVSGGDDATVDVLVEVAV